MALLNSVKSFVSKTSSGELSLGAGANYIDTAQGGDFISSRTTSDAQKRFSTKASIPNMPKPKSLFFTYYSLNRDAINIISKKREMIKYLNNQLNNKSNKNGSLKSSDRKKIETTLKDKVNNAFSSSINSISKSMAKITGGSTSNPVLESNNQSMTSVDYIPDTAILAQLGFELSKFTKSITKPDIKFDVSEHNEYNRKRLTFKKVNYGDISIDFFNVKENPVQQFFIAYLKLINQNFLCKSPNDWKKQIDNNHWDNAMSLNDWGFDLDSNFRLIDKISVCEYYMNRLMVYTYENPIIKSISFGDNTLGDFDMAPIKVSFGIEGITNDLLDLTPYNVQLVQSNDNVYLKNMVNGEIREDLATFLNMRYVAGLDYAINSATSFMKGLQTLSDGESLGKKIKNQLLDTGRQLGFAEEITLGQKISDTVSNFKESDDKGKYVFNVVDDPTSVVGTVTDAGSGRISTVTRNLLSLF